ncbi:MAG: chromosome segregation protein SMC [Tissierellia bacterium]|nr:chromosome segregation protein SMC [Tissierellia bacterium]
MHLKKIFIQGFKSFADKTEIEFKDGITAIVGPNGCGKSNVADAIRWVLGEQSVRTLRGSKMEDVIFSGTDKRRALGYAEVTIVFDNSDEKVPVEFQEVAITRRMFRSGESEYYINKNPCRLKDVRELLMDTGIGKDGYSVIGQGRIDEILSTKPEDRRHIFEEAAGIVKYKSKKMEAEKKLEKTDNNLIRIEDIIGELEIQYENLKEQSEKAQKYMELSNKVKEIEINLMLRKIEELQGQISKCMEEKEVVQRQIDQLEAQREKVEEESNLLRKVMDSKGLNIEKLQKDKENIMFEINNNKNRLTILEEKKKYYLKDVERLAKEIEELKLKYNKLKEDKKLLSSTTSLSKEELENFKEDYRLKSENLERLSENIRKREKEINLEKDRVITLYNTIADKKSKLNSISSFRDNIIKRISQIEKEIATLCEKKKQEQKTIKEMEIIESNKKEEIVAINKALVNLKLEEEKYKEKLDNLYKLINENKITLQGKITNYNLLTNMEEDYEGYYKSVKNLMLAYKKDKTLKDRLIGVVADLIKVDTKYEKAVEVALGGSLQNVVTKDEDDAKFIISYLRQRKLGRVTFLPLSTIKAKAINISHKDREVYSIIGLASELVQYDSIYKDIIEYLLGRTIVVENIDYATKVAKGFNYSYKIVTLEGDVVNPGGSITGGSMPKVNNLLNRKHRINKIKREINELTQVQSNLEKEKAFVKSKIDEYMNWIKEKENILQGINIEIIKIENEINKHSDELKRNEEMVLKYNEEINRLKIELRSIDEEEKHINEEISTLSAKREALEKEIVKSMEVFEERKKTLEEVKKEVTDAQIKINILENKMANTEEKIINAELELKNINDTIENKKKEREINLVNIDRVSAEILQVNEEIEKLLSKNEEKNSKLTLLKEEKDSLLKDYYLIQNKLKDVLDNIKVLENKKNHYSIKEAKYSTQLDNIFNKLEEEYNLTYDEAIEYKFEIENLKEAEDLVKNLKEEIKDLGTVYLDAIEEFRQVKERLEFLRKQHGDLLTAKEDLNKVIFDMEGKMKKQFIEKFKIINENFDVIFKKLFDGGTASIELVDEEDILNCGIEIKAQPPGKKLQNLDLLSGGERSLTAVALLFAVQKVKPSPFCVLDEIDAALDESNISKYTSYLMELAENTQFIIITHRKKTMEIADALYGVTMEEEGISKIVSVKLTDKLEDIAS